MQERELVRVLGKRIGMIMKESKIPFEKIQEIHLRIGQPIIILCDNGENILPEIVKKEDLTESLDFISKYSLYAFENELKQGFITIEGGHRVGVTGQVLVENDEVKCIRHISSMNIRVSHEILNCADNIFPYITNNKTIYDTLIVSPPGCGKTTLLRDLVRQVSSGNRWVHGCSVGVVDERSEIGGSYLGIAQKQLGMRTDVLDCCPKSEGMMMLIRSMGPRVIAVDEIGSVKDIRALEYAMHCGCKLLATVHGESMGELRTKPLFAELIKEHRFKRYIVLGNNRRVGEIVGIYDERGNVLFEE